MLNITLKKRIILIACINIFVALLLIISHALDFKTSYINGFGVGLFSTTLPFLIFLIIKFNNQEFKEEYDLSIQDERIKMNTNRVNSLAYKLQTILILSSLVISYLFEIKLYFIVLTIIFVTLVFSKLYIKKLCI